MCSHFIYFLIFFLYYFKDLDLNKIREEFLNNGNDVMDFETENSEIKVLPRPIVKRNPLVSLENNIVHPKQSRKPKKPAQNVSIFYLFNIN